MKIFRRAYVCLSVVGFLLAMLPAGYGIAATGIRAVDQPAIAVKDPDRVLLIAIARAGERLVAVGEHGVIIVSDDNGRTWKQASVPVSVTLTGIQFATPSDGWAVGHDGVILHTVDAGNHWQLQLDGLQANQITLAAAQQAVKDNIASPGLGLALKRANYFIQSGADKPFLSVLAIGPKSALAFGAYRMVMATTDGGNSWQDWSLRIGDPLSHNLYDAVNGSTNICVAAETGLVFCSSDNGASFPPVPTQPPATATLFGVLLFGDKGILTFGVAGGAYRSGDGGKTWETVNLDTHNNLMAGVVLTSGVVVLASEDGSFFISSDQGQTFRQLPQIVSSMVLSDLVQAPNGDLIAVGDSGVVRIPAQTFSQS